MVKVCPLLAILLALFSLPPARAEDGGKPLDHFFHGRVVAFDGKTLTLHYDFRDKTQLADWQVTQPFPVERVEGQRVEWFDGQLEVVGNTSAKHVATWTGDIAVACRLVPDCEKDLGGLLVPPEGEDFASFTLVERYFHGWDGKSGGGHGIIKFGKQWREAGRPIDFIGFRYVIERAPLVPLQMGKPVDFAFGIKGGRLYLATGDLDLKGKDPGKRLKLSSPSFYTVNGRILVDDVTITGRLDAAWAKKNDVALRVETPPGEEPAADPATLGLIEGYARGETAAAQLVGVVGDESKGEGLRAAAAQALEQGPKGAVPAVLDLLYRADVTSRTLGIGIIKALLGKDYGYKPTGSESSRSAAVRKLNQDLRDHPELLE